MTTTTKKNARDFLDKELFVNRNIVTFRSLSRELGIHVNDAKKELQNYYDAVRDSKDVSAVPTYLVSGNLPPLKVSSSSSSSVSDPADMAVDLDLDLDTDVDMEGDRVENGKDADADIVYQSQVLLVDARLLDETIAQFAGVPSVHIYSLSPSRLSDAGLICTLAHKIQRADATAGCASLAAVGKITGSHVKLRSGITRQQGMASTSKTTLDAPANRVAPAPPKGLVPPKAEQTTTAIKRKTSFETKQVSKSATTTTPLSRTGTIDKPKPSGKLDWSKAKTKEKEVVSEKKAKDVSKPNLDRTPTIVVPTKASSSAAKKPMAVRKEEESSDEDDEDGNLRVLGQRRRLKRNATTSDSEMSLRAMMDIDDDQVERVSRVSKVRPQPEESEESEEEVKEPKAEEEEEAEETEKSATVPPATSDGEESDDIPQFIFKKPRKPRKVIPVGSNGLKKRRVVKSRTTTDAKGYMQTEDYTSYESVEEEDEKEPELETKRKGKGKGKGKEVKSVPEPKVEEAKPKVIIKEESIGKPKAKSTPKPRGGAPKRGGLLNFFGPERGKK